MINLDNITNGNNKEHNEKWPFIPDHSHRNLIIGGSGKTSALLNLIKKQDDIYKIYLYAKDLSEPKYEFLISAKMQEQNTSVIEMHLLNVQMWWMTFIRILMITIQTEKEKF